ncbi:MAG: efflux RND transporter periplasmic adaptor subunit [Ruminococcus sp.]|uniref:efflux RND transporter periplasmic adaptor subunit n=1 Tax=Ruminococcus sp. TaxID=41978 RepID=UPI0025FEED95|nr:efflux RND transporter periplasmic adaptor subunit [Ruminococcus sp.]MBR5684302.1 efflux RND transporter periplasmic adaptor subunit [Ruminococcus sp.]
MSKSKKIVKRIVILLVILFIIGGIVMFVRSAIRGATQNIVMRSDTCGFVKRQDLTSYASFSGQISSSDKLMVTADPTLKVSKLNVKVGDNVKAGDILCEFDSKKLQEKYDKMVKNSEKAQGASQHSHDLIVRSYNKAKTERDSMISKAKSTYDTAVSKRDSAYETYNKMIDEYNKLYSLQIDAYNAWANAADNDPDKDYKRQVLDDISKEFVVSEKELKALEESLPELDSAVSAANEAYNTAVETGDELLQKAQDALDDEKYSLDDDSDDSQIEELRERIEKCTVRAERDGVVTELNISEGSVPESGNIMTIENTADLIVAGKVSEADILKVNEGMEAEIKTSATEDRIIRGRIKRIEKIISSGQAKYDQGGYTVEVSVEEKDSGLLIGMSASVKIILDKRENVLSVPYNAVRGGENEGYFIYVATPQENDMYSISKRKVSKGFEGDFYTEIISGYVNDGDIVLTDPMGVSDGDIIPLSVPEE